MKSEQLQKWALVAEIIGGLAVVLSLVFVALEIRQSSEETATNTKAISVSAYQDLIAQIIDINSAVMNDEELADILRRGQEGTIDSSTEPNDAERFRRYQINVRRHADLACFQYRQGIIDQERLSATLGIFLAEVVGRDRDGLPAPDNPSYPGLRDCTDIAISLRRSGEQ